MQIVRPCRCHADAVTDGDPDIHAHADAEADTDAGAGAVACTMHMPCRYHADANGKPKKGECIGGYVHTKNQRCTGQATPQRVYLFLVDSRTGRERTAGVLLRCGEGAERDPANAVPRHEERTVYLSSIFR